EALDGGGVAGAPDAEGADAEAASGVDGGDLVMETLDEGVDVVAAPVGAFEGAAGRAVLGPTGVVVEGDLVPRVVGLGVRIEVVVEVDAVDVVAADDVEDDGDGDVLD